MSSEHLLKVLSGNHQGAEVILNNEKAVIGSGDDSDIILSDSMVESHHAEITFSETKVTIKALDGQVFVDGKLVKDEEQEVSDFQFITIGSTHLIFGPANEPWPSISATDAPTLERSEEVIEKTNILEEKGKIDDENEDVIIKKTTIKSTRTKRTWIIGMSSVFVFAFALSLLIFLSIFSDENQIQENPDVHKLILNEIRGIGLTDTINVESDGINFIVTGYTDTNSELSILRSNLPKISQSIKLKLYSEERIVSEIHDLMASIQSNPKVECIKPGIFVISGYVYDKENWEKIRKRIVDDIPGIIDIQDEIIFPQKAFTLTRPILARYKLIGKVGILPQEDSIVIGGLVASDEEENWKLAKVQLERILGPDIPVQNFVRVSDPEVIKHQYFGSEVDSISISENGLNWIGFKNGTRYMVGSTLANGYTIKEITPETISLVKNNQEVILKIGDIQ